MSQTLTRHRSFTQRADVSPSRTTPSKVRRFQHPSVEDANTVVNANNKSKRSAKWIIINVLMLACFYMDFLQALLKYLLHWEGRLLNYIDFVLMLMCAWNTFTNLYFYCLPSLWKLSVQLNPYQRRLLGIQHEQERLFSNEDLQTSPAAGTRLSSPSYPIKRTASLASLTEYSPGRQSPSRSQYSPSRSQYSPSRPQYSPSRSGSSIQPQMHRASSFSPGSSPYVAGGSPYMDNGSPYIDSSSLSRNVFNTSRGKSPVESSKLRTSPGRVNSMDEGLLDFDVLDKYVKKEEENKEKVKRAQPDPSKQYSIWTFHRAAYDYMPAFCSYQLATKSNAPTSTGDDVIGSPYKRKEIWAKLGLHNGDVDQWAENMRKWLAESILEPLMREIDSTNNKLSHMGSPELHIGVISQSSLQMLAAAKSHQLPYLASLIPYLEVSANQEYLVARLRDLSTGGCLRLYKWNSGGPFNGKPWCPDLPTDAQIILHLFCTYMDTHLPLNPRYQHGKTFTGHYFLKTPSKPSEKKSNICLYQSRTQSPHFKILLEDDVIDLPEGRNNLVHALVMFVYYTKRNLGGTLERVKFGESGINILRILQTR